MARPAETTSSPRPKKQAKPRGRDALGCAPDQSAVVMILIDTINAFDFPRGADLLRFALPAAQKIAALKTRLRKRGIPMIYVNDNFGRWKSDFRSQVEHCLREDMVGAPVARMLLPQEEDYFVLKPKHSGFYSTTLDVLLEYLGAEKLILTGFASNLCVLYTANDAYMRDFELIIPSDCVAAETAPANRIALAQMKDYLRADTRLSRALRV